VQRVTLRISRIVDALLSFARDAGGDPVTPVAVEQIFADALALCRQRFVEHAIDLSVAPPAASLIVECRPVQLAQVLLNLLGNAHDAAQAAPERWVRLAAEVTDGSLQISVTDSGAGIPAMHRERIFEPFFTTKPSDRGTGLGLSLSRGIVEAHHGTLTLDERSAHTRFVIRMPLVQPPAARTSPARSER
jgi:signal transduction histidine kinase